MTVGLIILAAIVIFVLSGIKVVNQYQRGVVLTLGKFTGVKSPGLRLFSLASSQSPWLMCARHR